MAFRSWVRNLGYERVIVIREVHYYCAGCDQEMDIDLTHHAWEAYDEETDTTDELYYHVDCCPARHVTDGDCGEVDYEHN